jgi:hypothetical protein
VTIDELESTDNRTRNRLSKLMLEDAAMCDGEGLGFIQMAMTPIGLVVTAGIAGALFLFARWVMAD